MRDDKNAFEFAACSSHDSSELYKFQQLEVSNVMVPCLSHLQHPTFEGHWEGAKDLQKSLAIQAALVRSHVSSLEGQWEGAKDLQRSLAIQAALVRSHVSSLEGQWEGAKDLQRSLAIQAALVRSHVSSLEGQWEGAKDLQRSLAIQADLVSSVACHLCDYRFKIQAAPSLALLLSVCFTLQPTMEEPKSLKYKRKGGHQQQRRVRQNRGSSIDDASTEGEFFATPGAKTFVESWCWGQLSVPRLQN
jgi:hypothetical protein